MFQGPKERLNEDFVAQVAVYTISCMVADRIEGLGIRAAAMAPYSSGLYAAAYAAGVLGFEAGLTLMREADRCIRKQKIGGGMGVVLGLSASEVEPLCAEVQAGVVEVSIANTHHQTIVSGDCGAVDELLRLAAAAEALKTDRLPATAPYHCSLLAEADRCLAKVVDQTPMTSPHTPIVSYIDCGILQNSAQVKGLLSCQLHSPVQWANVVEELVRREAMPMIEIGPGQMLSRSVRWIHRHAVVLHTETAAALQDTIDFLSSDHSESLGPSRPVSRVR
jgi:[acyl-carrier-protein] S-malonyltransferase